MIVDRMDRWQCYPIGPVWKRVFDFLLGLEPGAEEKRYTLQGEDVFAFIDSYVTLARSGTKPEAHRKYADIQTLLWGTERMEWFPVDSLDVDVPYDESKDAGEYKLPEREAAGIDLRPGTFALLFPHDAHLPQLSVADTPERVKKVVVKINVQLLKP